MYSYKFVIIVARGIIYAIINFLHLNVLKYELKRVS